MRQRLTYANVTATLALFLALGGASYAAVHVGKNSVGTPQLRTEAVSTAKIKNGAITEAKLGEGAITETKLAEGAIGTSRLATGAVTESKLGVGSVTTAKIADGAVTGAQVATATLGTVPHASHAHEADKATESEASKEAEFLRGRSAADFGQILSEHTEIPATAVDAEWWVPVSGMGQALQREEEVQMIIPGVENLSALEFRTRSTSGLARGAAAKVEVQLMEDNNPIGVALSPSPDGFRAWYSSREIPLWGELAIHVIEKVNGEEIPAFPLETALQLLPVR